MLGQLYKSINLEPQRRFTALLTTTGTLLVSACSAAGNVDFRNPIGIADCPLTAQPLEVTSQLMLII